jgi:hypothetical protein
VNVPVGEVNGWVVEYGTVSQDRSVRFFAWAGRGFRAKPICVPLLDWLSYRLEGASWNGVVTPLGDRGNYVPRGGTI